MDHDYLLALFRRLALASAPLVTAGCGGNSCPNPSQCCSNPSKEATVSLASLASEGGVDDAGVADGGIADLCAKAVPNQRVLTCELVTDNGQPAVHVVYTSYCVGGRRPAGLAASGGRSTSPLGAWLANMTHLEAASVDAFLILADELAVHRAPEALVGAARAAARDERRHARLMGRLASAAGARPARARVARRDPRDLEAVATENAVEGCVRETFAALVGCRQARAAADQTIQRTMRVISADETRHAALSWTIDAWARDRLRAPARRRVREARLEATEVLLRELAVTEPDELRVPAGLPAGDEAVGMGTALFRGLRAA